MNEHFLTPSRFRILQEIVRSPASVSEIARRIEISIPYVLNQVTLLEAKGIISKQETNSQKGPGKPKKVFQLTEAIINLTVLHNGFGKQFSIEKPNPILSKYFQLISFINRHKQSEFSTYYWSLLKEFNKAIAIGHIDTQEDKVELIAISELENLEELRKSISNKSISNLSGKKVTFVCWVHTFNEFKKGCEQKDFYYDNLKKRVTPMYDPNRLFEKI